MEEEQNIPEESHEPPALSHEQNEVNENIEQSQTKNMETHAHHLHKAPGKKIWHYFFEFLMLFLAVTLGFFVENIREKYVEKERARQYAINLLQDLKADSIQLSENININETISKKADTLRTLIYSSDRMNIPNGKFYYYGRYITWYNRFTPNDATFQQMKSSGAIRYFHNPSLENKLSTYDRIIRTLAVREVGEWDGMNDMWQIYSQLFYGNILDSIMDLAKPYASYKSFIANNYPLLNNDRTLLVRLANLCRSRQLFIKFKIEEAYQPALIACKELMAELKKEYYLKNE